MIALLIPYGAAFFLVALAALALLWRAAPFLALGILMVWALS